MQPNERDLQRAKALAQTDAARRLMQLLQTGDPARLRKILDSAGKGDLAAAQRELSGLMDDPQAKKLLQELGGGHG